MKRRVLIVDDETNIRQMMRITLEADGYDVEEAADGQTALELFGDGARFDAVVLDQRMPGMDGIETLKRIRRSAPDATILMVTAFGSIELAVDAMKAGARDFLRKPLTPALLRDALRAALSKQEAAQQGSRAAGTPPSAVAAGPHEIWTVNGFFIRRSAPAVAVAATHEYRFSVRHAARGPQGEVLVTIDAREVARITRLSGRPDPPSRSFWAQQAERALMNYLFLHAALPSDDRLVVGQLPDEAVLLARTWNDS